MASPRIHVSFNQIDYAAIQEICRQKKMSKSNLVRKVMEEWIERHQNSLIAKLTENENGQ
jgi:hypothetical protein